MRQALVGILCDRRGRGDAAYDAVEEEYIRATRFGAGALPLLVPHLDPPLPPAEVLGAVDGLLFTGSPSNVAPRHYGGADPRPGTKLDEARDATVLPLLRAAIAEGVPVFCICRGFQELNVALGGALHQYLHEMDGVSDHRAPEGVSASEKYRPRHEVKVSPGGMLARLFEGKPQGDRFHVNSLHSQGIAKLAPSLRIEAMSPDGVVEAVSLKQPKGFLLAVQWHPEWNFSADSVSRALFAAFGEAVSSRAQENRGAA